MTFIGDFHIHSHFSIATSKKLIPEYLDTWARIKGITVVGTGDFTHPGWLAELKEKLTPAEEGLFQLKTPFTPEAPLHHDRLRDAPVRFMLTAEVSNIYKRDGRTRKVHNVIFAPDFETVERIQTRLDQIGNITSDGRPILGLDSRDLLEICLDASPDIFFVPAHIWTPWFSALGSKSGFDTIDQAYADLAGHIHAVETGLSADPPLHWMCSHLDRFTSISNSDAHSPEKLGREANLLDTALSYPAIIQAIKSGDERFQGTIEFFPQEGKYHYDGHRKCGVCWNPAQTLAHGEICPECGKKVTVGVMNRAAVLSDRADLSQCPVRKEFTALIPLKEVISELEGVGPNSKRVNARYHHIIGKLGAELDILLNLSLGEIESKGGEMLTEAVRRIRAREVIIQEGYDGEYGRITVFDEKELAAGLSQNSLFIPDPSVTRQTPPASPLLRFDLHEYRQLRNQTLSDSGDSSTAGAPSSSKIQLNERQRAAVHHGTGPALVIAGPGTGKTRVLTRRIQRLIGQGEKPEHILAVTFTNKAAREMRERLTPALSQNAAPVIDTFHGLGYQLLREYHPVYSQTPFTLIDGNDRKRLLENALGFDRKEAARLSDEISDLKRELQIPEGAFARYQNYLEAHHLLDLDDLIYQTVLMLRDVETASRVRARFRWILVDEYQDINRAQYQMIRLLAPEEDASLMVIGDPDQAIYGFRGSDIRFIRQFQDDYPRAAAYPLTTSYRCSKTILKASHHVVKSGGDALVGLQEGVQIHIAGHATDRSEAEWTARTIEQMMGGLRFFSMDSGITLGHARDEISSLSDFAVLFRTHRQMRALEKAFEDHAIPCQTVGGHPLFQREPAKSIIDTLKWGCASEVQPPLALIPEKIRSRIGSLGAILKSATVEKIIEGIIGKWPPKNSASDLNHLLEIARTFRNDVPEFLRFAALGTAPDLYRPNLERVTLMTLHAAKGLEFPCVFIIGCEDGLLPYSLHENQPADPEEERRLLYVGMTRAQHFLFLSHAAKRFLMGRELTLARSPFLNDIQEALIQRIQPGYDPKTRPKDDQMTLF